VDLTLFNYKGTKGKDQAKRSIIAVIPIRKPLDAAVWIGSSCAAPIVFLDLQYKFAYHSGNHDNEPADFFSGISVMYILY
jgi:hypothetical protein